MDPKDKMPSPRAERKRPAIATLPPYMTAVHAVAAGLFRHQRAYREFIARAGLTVIKRGLDRVVLTTDLLDALEGATQAADESGEVVAVPRAKTPDELLAAIGLRRAGGA